MRWTRLATAMAAAALAGCATNAPSSVLAEGPRMVDLYRGTAAEADPAPESEAERREPPLPAKEARCRWGLFTWPCEAPEAAGEEIDEAAPDAVGYARTAANELELLFPRLPNPDVYIHVLPHLATAERVPVPGYTTAVPLYECVEYALPGELERAARLLDPATAAGPVDGSPPEGGGAP